MFVFVINLKIYLKKHKLSIYNLKKRLIYSKIAKQWELRAFQFN